MIKCQLFRVTKRYGIELYATSADIEEMKSDDIISQIPCPGHLRLQTYIGHNSVQIRWTCSIRHVSYKIKDVPLPITGENLDRFLNEYFEVDKENVPLERLDFWSQLKID